MATTITSEMTANVWKVHVVQGDRVSVGDTLVVLEAMKMEIPIVTEVPGTVAEIRAQEGGSVEEGDVIAVIDD